jgi:hypothetical protein
MHITFRSPTHHATRDARATHTAAGGATLLRTIHPYMKTTGQILDELDEIHNHIIIHNTTTKGSIYGGEY